MLKMRMPFGSQRSTRWQCVFCVAILISWVTRRTFQLLMPVRNEHWLSVFWRIWTWISKSMIHVQCLGPFQTQKTRWKSLRSTKKWLMAHLKRLLRRRTRSINTNWRWRNQSTLMTWSCWRLNCCTKNKKFWNSTKKSSCTCTSMSTRTPTMRNTNWSRCCQLSTVTWP